MGLFCLPLFYDILKSYICSDSMTQLVGAMSLRPKGHEFDSQSGLIPRLWVRSPVGAHMRRQWINVSLSHQCFSLSFPLSLSLSLPLPFFQSNFKNVLRWRFFSSYIFKVYWYFYFSWSLSGFSALFHGILLRFCWKGRFPLISHNTDSFSISPESHLTCYHKNNQTHCPRGRLICSYNPVKSGPGMFPGFCSPLKS